RARVGHQRVVAGEVDGPGPGLGQPVGVGEVHRTKALLPDHHLLDRVAHRDRDVEAVEAGADQDQPRAGRLVVVDPGDGEAVGIAGHDHGGVGAVVDEGLAIPVAGRVAVAVAGRVAVAVPVPVSVAGRIAGPGRVAVARRIAVAVPRAAIAAADPGRRLPAPRPD